MSWAPDYVTTDEARAYLRIDDTADNDQLAMWISTASRMIDQHCDRQFGQVDTAEARTYPAVCGVVQLDDLAGLTGFGITDADDVVVTEYTLSPLNAPAKGQPWTRLVVDADGPVTVTGRWGWAEVPQAVKVATLLQTARLAVRRDSPFGIAGSPTEGSETRLLASVDPDVKTSLRPYVRRNWRVG